MGAMEVMIAWKVQLFSKQGLKEQVVAIICWDLRRTNWILQALTIKISKKAKMINLETKAFSFHSKGELEVIVHLGKF